MNESAGKCFYFVKTGGCNNQCSRSEALALCLVTTNPMIEYASLLIAASGELVYIYSNRKHAFKSSG